MLKPALLYADEITRKFAEHLYTTDYYYYCGYYCGSTLPKIEEKDDLYQYAFVDAEDNVIGFLTYRINDYSDTVQNFGLFSFEKGNLIVARDLFNKLKDLVHRHHRVEWCVVGNNPVKRNYDRFCKKYNGYIHHYHETTKDERGNYIDSFLYEIVNTNHRGEQPHREPTKLLTVGCSVKYHGRIWEIKRFMVDSENQTIAEIESRDNGEIILRRTMAPVEELEAVE